MKLERLRSGPANLLASIVDDPKSIEVFVSEKYPKSKQRAKKIDTFTRYAIRLSRLGLVEEVRGVWYATKHGRDVVAMRFKPVTIPPEDAQFLETRLLQTTETRRWFGIPPNAIADGGGE